MPAFFRVERGLDNPSAVVFPTGLAPIIRLAPDDDTVSGGRLALAVAVFRLVLDSIAKVQSVGRAYNARGVVA